MWTIEEKGWFNKLGSASKFLLWPMSAKYKKSKSLCIKLAT